jgi:hypothetical protein
MSDDESLLDSWFNKLRQENQTIQQPFWFVNELFCEEIIEWEYEDPVRSIYRLFNDIWEFIDEVNYIQYLFDLNSVYWVDLRNRRRVYRMFDDVPYIDEISSGSIPNHVVEWMLNGNGNFIRDNMILRSLVIPDIRIRNTRLFGDNLENMTWGEVVVYKEICKYIPHSVVIVHFRPGWLAFENKTGWNARELDLWFPEWELGVEYNGEWHDQPKNILRDAQKVQRMNELDLDLLVISSEDDLSIVIPKKLIEIKGNNENRAGWRV